MSEKDDVKALVAQMTLEEKASLCSGDGFWRTKGLERLGLPSVVLTDGPNGLRKQQSSNKSLGIYDSVATTCFPAGCALANTFDRDLMEQLGTWLGRECQSENVALILGPSINIKRNPLGGRNFEYYSEDPVLSGELGAAFVKGVQSQGVSACVKHFAANNQETRRLSSNSVMSQRTLHEIYLPAFETVIKKAKPNAVMCAYNQVNGTFCSENYELLTKTLRQKWGFDGMVVTDWGAVKDCIKGIKAGVNLEMPSNDNYHARVIADAVRSGQLAEEELDKAVTQVVRLLARWQNNYTPTKPYDREEHYRHAVDVAKECAVLLKNDGHILPLKKTQKVAFLGAYAQKPRTQAFGSSRIESYKVVSALDAAADIDITYAPGYSLESDEIDEKLLAEAVEAAKAADVAVVFVGLPAHYETEGLDRKTLALPKNHDALVEAVAAVNPNCVVVLHNGSVVDMPWMDRVRAILEMYLAGDGIGDAVVSLLYGDSNPCGKLAETFPNQVSDNPSYLNFPGELDQVQYTEGVFVGYRYYDKRSMAVCFPFGHGLSYTTFAYSDLKLSSNAIAENDTVTVSVKITNTGECFGKEIVQLYVHNPDGMVIRPVRELRNFAKVALAPGQTKEVTFTLDRRAFAYFNENIDDYAVESGDYTIELGSSSRDIRCIAQLQVQAVPMPPVVVTLKTCIADVLDRPSGRELFAKLMDFYQVKDDDNSAKKESARRDVVSLAKQYAISTMTIFSSLKEEDLLQYVERINSEQPD